MRSAAPGTNVLAVIAALSLLCGLCGHAAGFEGRYVGSLSYSEADDVSRIVQHRYDVGTLQTLAPDVNMDLRMSLRYNTRPGEPDSDVLNTRFHGDVRGRLWSLRGQFVPWQDIAPGATPPRERGLQLGFQLTPERAPRLSLNYNRGDRESPAGRSRFEDRHAELTHTHSHTLGTVRTMAGFRRLDSRTLDTAAPASRTDEWKGGLGVTSRWRDVTLNTQYEILASAVTSAERERDFRAQRLNANAAWDLGTKVDLASSVLLRRGRTQDTSVAEDRRIDDRSVSVRADYRPWRCLTLQTSRDYQRRATPGGNLGADFLRFRGTFRRPVVPNMMFQSGVQQTIDLRSEEGELPNSSAYAQVDGTLRAGLGARAELRTARPAASGRQWRGLVQLRADPIRQTHLELTWTRARLPEVAGVAQRDQGWKLLTTYDPNRALNVTGAFDWKRGRGRVETTERSASVQSSWRFSQRSSFELSWSGRRSRVLSSETSENTFGADLSFWLPREYRIVTGARHYTGRDRPRVRSWSLTVDKSFQ